jgi:hypothetical protein
MAASSHCQEGIALGCRVDGPSNIIDALRLQYCGGPAVDKAIPHSPRMVVVWMIPTDHRSSESRRNELTEQPSMHGVESSFKFLVPWRL